MKALRLLIHAKPERAAAVRARLASLHGVKVHATTPDGGVFVTIERENEQELTQELENLRESPDVRDAMEVDGGEVTAGGTK